MTGAEYDVHACSPGTRHSEGEYGRKSPDQDRPRLYGRMAGEGKAGEREQGREGLLNKHGHVSVKLFMGDKIWISYSSPMS